MMPYSICIQEQIQSIQWVNVSLRHPYWNLLSQAHHRFRTLSYPGCTKSLIDILHLDWHLSHPCDRVLKQIQWSYLCCALNYLRNYLNFQRTFLLRHPAEALLIQHGPFYSFSSSCFIALLLPPHSAFRSHRLALPSPSSASHAPLSTSAVWQVASKVVLWRWRPGGACSRRLGPLWSRDRLGSWALQTARTFKSWCRRLRAPVTLFLPN